MPCSLTIAVIALSVAAFVSANGARNLANSQIYMGQPVGAPPSIVTAPTTYYIDEPIEGVFAHVNATPNIRLVSISFQGGIDRDSQRYSTVWLPPDTSVNQSIVTNLSPADFVSFAQDMSLSGYSPLSVSCMGEGNSSMCAGLLETTPGLNSTLVCDMTFNQFASNNSLQTSLGRIMISLSQYGWRGQYCAIWQSNLNHEINVWYTSRTLQQYQAIYATQTSKPYWRPAYLGYTNTGNLNTIFRDTDLGSWASVVNISRQDFDAAATDNAAKGLFLIQMQVFGSGDSIRISGIWTANGLSTEERTWNAQGSTFGFADNRQVEQQMDQVMQAFMQNTGLRQSQLAVSKEGKLLAERAYTWAEKARPLTQTSDTFLLCSVSKMFCSAAIISLFEKYNISGATKPFADPGSPDSDPRFNVKPWQDIAVPLNDTRMRDITIQQLLNHTAGWDRSRGIGDPCWNMPEVSKELNLTVPPSILQFITYLRNHSLDYLPGSLNGSDYIYSNNGYVVLSAIVETITQKDYSEYMSTAISPDVQIWHTAASAHANSSVTQESWQTGLSAIEFMNNTEVAAVYGGDGMYKETAIGTCGLAASASTLARFLGNNAAWGIGGNCGCNQTSPCWRDGQTRGTRSYVISLPSCIDFAFNLNSEDAANDTGIENGIWFPLQDVFDKAVLA